MKGCFLSNEVLLFSKTVIYLCSKILFPESGPDEPVCRVGIEMRTSRTDMRTIGEGGKVG